MLILEAGPPTFDDAIFLNFHDISKFKNSVEKTVSKREPMGTPKVAQRRCRGGSYRFWYHFSSHLGSFLGAHGPLKNS